MREIKFRAWDKEEKGIYYVAQLRFDLSYSAEGYTPLFAVYLGSNHQHSIKEVELMQFTGLKDKNGKEIYEGDILEYKFNKLVDFRNGEKIEPEWIRERRVMRFIEDRFSFAKDIKKPNYFEYPSMSEVIGNIYENPELVAQKNMEG